MEAAEIARALGHADAEQRRLAVLAMRGRAEPALGPLLLRALGDQDWRVREEAIGVGRELAERLDLMRELIAALRESDNIGLRNAALALLKLLGRCALPALLSALPALDSGARRLVIEAIGHGGDADVVRKLAEVADAHDLNLATSAIEALAVVGGRQAEAVLQRKLAAKSPFERVAALEALDRLQAAVPFAALAPLLLDRTTLRGAVRALGRSNAREAVPALLAALADRSDSVAGAAAIALAQLGADAGLRAELNQKLPALAAEPRERLRMLAKKPDAVGAAAARLLALPAEAAVLAAPQVAVASAPAAHAGLAVELRTAAWTRGPRLEGEDFRGIGELIRRYSGIRFSDELRPTVERRLGERLGALGLSSFAEYQRLLRSDPASGELERAVEAIVTNETYFFRDLPQLRSFEHEVLPELHALAHKRRSLSVWSAGCSTGEEAYTLAILLARAASFSGWNLRVFGNDISRRVVQAARRGVYRGSSFRALPPEYEPHFVKTSEGSAVDPAIRALCHFARFNLLDEASAAMFGRVDAIFCRNVLIYFDDEARRRVIENFYERLQPGGYLMLGHSDSLLHVTTAFELAHLAGDLAYRKPLTADSQR